MLVDTAAMARSLLPVFKLVSPYEPAGDQPQAIAQLTEGSRRVYAVLSEHINPFNHALQMPDVHSIINLTSDKGRAMADVMVSLQAQIIAFSQDYQMVMLFTLCAIPLAIMIGSTKLALRKQSLAPEHSVME